MRFLRLVIFLPIILLLYGCDSQKSHQEYLNDVKAIHTHYHQCVADGVAKPGDVFCQYVLEDPEGMYELLRLGDEDPQKLGSRLLDLQQKLAATGEEQQQEFNKLNHDIKRYYLVLKLLSSIK